MSSVEYKNIGKTKCGLPIDNVKICVDWDEWYSPIFEWRELVNLGNAFNNCRTNFWIAKKDLHKFKRNFGRTDYRKLVKHFHTHWKAKTYKKGWDKYTYEMYACSSLCRDTGMREIRHLGTFRTDNTTTRFYLDINDYSNDITPNYRKLDNLKVIRRIQEGSPHKPLRCQITGKVLENIRVTRGKDTKFIDMFTLHHLLVKNGRSVGKTEKRGPAKLINLGYIKTDKKIITELLQTSCLSLNQHKVIHEWSNSDISFFKNSELPWALRNERNFNSICKEYDLKLDYTKFKKSLLL